MKKGIILILLITFGVFVSTNITFAASSLGRVFGGEIVSIEANPIKELESLGYACIKFGTTVSIMPIGSPAGTPTDYFIPYYEMSKTGITPVIGGLIAGMYTSMRAYIPCILSSTHPDVKVISLDTMILFGTSGI